MKYQPLRSDQGKKDQTRCESCGIKILPNNDENLQTLTGSNIFIHTKDYYVLEIRCTFCGLNNFIYKKGLTEEQANEILELVTL